MKPKSKAKKICHLCRAEVMEAERHCSLTSFENKKIINTDYWHDQCWKTWINNAVERRVQGAYQQAVDLIGKFQENEPKSLFTM